MCAAQLLGVAPLIGLTVTDIFYYKDKRFGELGAGLRISAHLLQTLPFLILIWYLAEYYQHCCKVFSNKVHAMWHAIRRYWIADHYCCKVCYCCKVHYCKVSINKVHVMWHAIRKCWIADCNVRYMRYMFLFWAFLTMIALDFVITPMELIRDFEFYGNSNKYYNSSHDDTEGISVNKKILISFRGISWFMALLFTWISCLIVF